MSRIYFHSRAGDTEVGGAERGWMGYLCQRTACGFLELPNSVLRLRKLVPSNHYLNKLQRSDLEWGEMFETAFAVSGCNEHLLEWRGRELNPFTIILNTALLFGNDVVRLAARLHGQCEVHAYVRGENREWLAGIIDQGLESGLLRKTHSRSNTLSSGWAETSAMLRSRSNIPVVTSYSVCDQFPNASFVPRDSANNECVCGNFTLNRLAFGTNCFHCGIDTSEITREEWRDYVYDIPNSTIWSRATTELMRRDQEGHLGLELRPDNWSTFCFGDGVTVLDLVGDDSDSRLEAKLGGPNGD